MTEEAVRAQIARILASPQFSRSQRLSRFLRLAVDVALAGDGATLKEYRIGVEVFDRGEGFDPRSDPIVRVQAAKLRSKLLEYYSASGGHDAIVIAVPKGSYVAQIRSAEPPAAAHAPAAGTIGERPPTRLAVLPFVSLGSDGDDRHFADGLTEELINRLAQVPTLQVVARTSAYRFQDRAEDLREVGRQLNVTVVVEGSVRHADGRIRAVAQLIDVATGFHLLSRTYQREYRDVFELQDELAQAIVDEITHDRGAVPRLRLSRPPSDFAAYVACKRGMLALAQAFPELGAAERLFREAIRLDPDFAPAWGGLAHTHWLQTWYRLRPASETMRPCKDAAQRTFELDPDAAEGHCSLGIVASGFEWRWSAAEASFERAIALRPSLAMIYPFYAVVCLLPQRKFDRACAAIDRSLELDPFNGLFLAIGSLTYACAGRHGDVHRLHRLGVDLNPQAPPTAAVEAFCKEVEGDLEGAIEGFGDGASGGRPELIGFYGHALAAAGRREEAQRCIERLQAQAMPAPLDIARVHVGLRDADDALASLTAAVAQRSVHLILVPADPRFDWLRRDPRYDAVMQPLGLSRR